MDRDYRQASKEERGKLKEDLKKLVGQQFETQQRHRNWGLTRFEEELKRLRDADDRREKNGPQIIEKRVSELLDEETEAGFIAGSGEEGERPATRLTVSLSVTENLNGRREVLYGSTVCV